MTRHEAIGAALGKVMGPTFSRDVVKFEAALREAGFAVVALATKPVPEVPRDNDMVTAIAEHLKAYVPDENYLAAMGVPDAINTELARRAKG